LGVTGTGIVVAGQDTGYEWDHPALMRQYRGWDGAVTDHTYNWHDAWGEFEVPTDEDGHGTHTMGTVLGHDGDDNRTGVAPDAQWIGCRICGAGGESRQLCRVHEFFLAPYPQAVTRSSKGMCVMRHT
jgi:subtilisin family serine protease